MGVLGKQDAQRIELAIADLERRSAAEFVVAVLPTSASYAGLRALLAVCWGLAAGIIHAELAPQASAFWSIAVQFPAAAAGWFFSGIPALLRWLVPHARAERAVAARAFQIFAERGVHQTRDRTGILMLVSELERRVVLLGDRGIHERVGTEGWSEHVAHVITRIREGRAADGILEVMQRLEPALARGLPVQADDTNELPNEIVRS